MEELENRWIDGKKCPEDSTSPATLGLNHMLGMITDIRMITMVLVIVVMVLMVVVTMVVVMLLLVIVVVMVLVVGCW